MLFSAVDLEFIEVFGGTVIQISESRTHKLLAVVRMVLERLSLKALRGFLLLANLFFASHRRGHLSPPRVFPSSLVMHLDTCAHADMYQNGIHVRRLHACQNLLFIIIKNP